MQGVAQNRDRLTYWVDFIKRRITPGFIVMGPHSNNADVWYDISLVSAENPVQEPKLQIGVQMKDANFFYCSPGEQRTVLGTDVAALQRSGFRALAKLGML